jgi:endonuclease-3
MMRSKLNKGQIESLFKVFKEREPEPRGELVSVNDFTFLIAVVLSAQATDISVNKATKELFKTAKTPEDFLKLGVEGIEKHIKTIGLYRSKAKNVISLCEKLISDFSSEIPDNLEQLVTLPGVGRKTANVVLNEIFDQPTIAVDTHLFRVGNRIGFAPGKTPIEVEHMMQKLIPLDYKKHAHHWLILHGRYICLARKPRCPVCPVAHLCKYKNKTKEAV